eukprot:1743763-Amphidinium_carterae.1
MLAICKQVVIPSGAELLPTRKIMGELFFATVTVTATTKALDALAGVAGQASGSLTLDALTGVAGTASGGLNDFTSSRGTASYARPALLHPARGAAHPGSNRSSPPPQNPDVQKKKNTEEIVNKGIFPETEFPK